MTEQMNPIFVYGTLRKGSSNHELMRTASFLGKGKTALPYALYLGEYPYVYKKESRCRIIGEVYSVDSATLKLLDELEEHPEVYRREPADIILDSGERLTCWLYFYPRQEGEPHPSGDYFNSPCDPI